VSTGGPGTVVHVTYWNSSYLGSFMASELALAAMVRERFGLETHLVLGPGGGDQPWTADLDAAGVTWSVVPERRRELRAHLDALLRERRGRLIHTHFTAGDLAGAGAARAAGVPCVWHVHTGFLGYPLRQRLKDLWKVRVVGRRGVARVIVLGPGLAELLRRRGVPADRVVTLPNAIAEARFGPLPPRDEARRRLGLAPDATVALALGWWPEVKGVDLMLDALGELAARDGAAPVTGLLVGEDAMRAFIDERLGPDHPAWLAQSGFVSDPAWLYAAADLFVSASRHEGQSYAIGEALACGLPVVLSDIPGTRLYEEAAGTVTFPSGDVAALAAAITRVAGEPAAAHAAAREANRAWAREHLSLARWCEGVCDVYAPLLRGA
jgi:glycosyltransferase involved in cell wall biosynthesis